ncbi:electron transfer flavoprotein subunit alpha [Halodesulfurarchaeum formicicum]|uniref:Electron transfer flavoprotein subunit alpha n=1 Tax=Halodesulfurarchaeum formicicum TaxID=1873524 RepID=A0A1D8S241_9EURY|nr:MULTISPECIES: electron transfer flavoprotein subunit alpha/FixB family protein [Halodesulfurarchaeum]AOW79427.1 electron transfer flavoprotein subunit alpha [Halodesulfurarchaeum formicicum]APE94680.1 electron transfer flavoprotein subunit alpha [Halodesulfurarchaeum formicicum]MDR5655952.1 electron transfer flavoprotein subunit alpha/FixB family protein [Halodesulfurarchaeum sp. HSR-GB]
MSEQLIVVPEWDGCSVLGEAQRLKERLEATSDSDVDVVVITMDGIHDMSELDVSAADEHLTLRLRSGEFEPSTTTVSVRVRALQDIVTDRDPLGVFFPSTPDGDEMAATLASTTGGAGLLDSLLEVKNGELIGHRPVFDKRALVTFEVENRPLVASLSMDGLPEPSSGAETPPVQHSIEVEGVAEEGVERLRTIEVPEKDISKAKVVVAGGDGLESRDDFQVIRSLADSLNATVGASRPLVDEGWVAHDRQIGVTGKSVDADLYVPVAISGDPYHLDDVQAEHILAINTDPNARVFDMADIGVLGDFETYGPKLTEAIQATHATNSSDAEEPRGEE